jgi:hypothetical protein
MTLVAAFRSSNRVVIMSDSLITNRDASRPNAVPGRLKSVVVNGWLTISYAGLSSQALDCIRSVHRDPSLTTDEILSYLSASSRSHSGEVEFIVSSHEFVEMPRLVKVHGDHISEGEDTYWIGDRDAAREFFRLELAPLAGETGGEYYTLAERRFTRRFHEFMRTTMHEGVGGLVVEALASPFGHCYNDSVAAYVERLTIPDSVAPELRVELNNAGMNGYYSYSVFGAPERGKAVVGMYFEQAETGFLHSPLEADDPFKIRAATQDEFQSFVRNYGESRLG